MKEADRKLAAISRVVLRPKYRNIGLGVKLVRDALPLVGRSYVETIGVMAKYNPFSEKAGMRKPAVRRPGKSIRKAVSQLTKMRFKPYLMASTRPNLEHLKARTVEDLVKTKEIHCSVCYHKRLRSSSKPYIKRKEFKKWMSEKPLKNP